MKMRQREILNKINIDFARDGESQEDYIQRKIGSILSVTREYLVYSAAKGFLLCLSGGIDSYAAAALMADAAKGINGMLHLLLLSDSPKSQQNAQACVDALISQFDNITYEELSIEPIYGKIEKSLEKSIFAEHFDSYRRENIKSRLRMIYQYALSKNLLVVGTVHATERIIGHYTKYGDGGSDFNPLDGLIKIDIYDIARIYKAPECVMSERPEAGFEITDYEDDGVGVTYPELSQYLTGNLLDREKMQRIVSLHDKTEHKRNTPASPINLWWRKQSEDVTHIVVNMIKSFINGKMPCINAAQAVSKAAAYIDAHPEMRVLYVRDHHPADHCSFIENGGRFLSHAITGTPECCIAPEFFTIQKTINSPLVRYNVFSKGMDKSREIESGFDAINEDYGALKYNLTGHVVVSGMTTEYCVLNTVCDLIKNGFHVTVLKDALAYLNQEEHNAALQKMADMGVSII